MTLSDMLFRQQKLLALQAILLSFFISLIMVVAAITYAKTTIYDKQIEAKKVKSIEQNKAFEQMYQNSAVRR